MSSPIARFSRNPVRSGLVALHQRMSHRSRTRLLAQALAGSLRAILAADAATIRAVDIGCGDMRIAEILSELEPRLAWTCLDIHAPPPEASDPRSRWAKYRQFDGRRLAFEDRTFGVALLTDVLHHVPEEDRPLLLREAGRVAQFVIVKDHFEYGPASRLALRAMDFVGNWGYGIRIPERYFSSDTFAALLTAAELEKVSLMVGIQLYAHLPGLRRLLDPAWQFIAVARRR